LFRSWALTTSLFKILVIASLTSTVLTVSAFALPLGQEGGIAIGYGLACFIVSGVLSVLALFCILFAAYVYYSTDPDYVIRFERSLEQTRGLQPEKALPPSLLDEPVRNPNLAAGYRKGPVGLMVSAPVVLLEEPVRNPALAAGYQKGPVGLKVTSPAILLNDDEPVRNPALADGYKKGPLGLPLSATIDKKTGEFQVGADSGGQSPAATARSRKMTIHRVENSARRQMQAESLYHHNLVYSTLTSTNGVVTDEVISKAEEEVHGARVQLKGATVLCEMHKPPPSSSMRKAMVRAQTSTLLKMAAILAEDPGSRTEQPFTSRFGSVLFYVSWTLLFTYIFGLSAYIIIWVFSQEHEQRFLLEQAYNMTNNGTYNASVVPVSNQQVSAQTNSVLVNWLFNALINLVVAYLAIEPLLIFIRYALLPSVLRRYGNKPDPSLLRPQRTDIEKHGRHLVAGSVAEVTDSKSTDNIYVQTCLDMCADIVQAVG